MLNAELKVQERSGCAVAQRNIDHFTVGLVGYTNAGKSTVFNSVTEGGAYADDRVFATLMTRTRQWDLGGGLACMLSDTVGFVRDLPHHLVASFRATLEEATHADLLLIVLDVSDPSAEMHYKTVASTLDELFEDVERRERKLSEAARRDGAGHRAYAAPERVVLLNKVDKLPDNRELLVWTNRIRDAIPVCGLPTADGRLQTGHEAVVERVRRAMIGELRELAITVPLSDAKTIHTIENRATVQAREYHEDAVTLRVTIGARQLDRLRSAGARMRLATPEGVPVEAEAGDGWGQAASRG
ncbi:MAG: GTPase [Phycisphaerales bacterium]